MACLIHGVLTSQGCMRHWTYPLHAVLSLPLAGDCTCTCRKTIVRRWLVTTREGSDRGAVANCCSCLHCLHRHCMWQRLDRQQKYAEQQVAKLALAFALDSDRIALASTTLHLRCDSILSTHGKSGFNIFLRKPVPCGCTTDHLSCVIQDWGDTWFRSLTCDVEKTYPLCCLNELLTDLVLPGLQVGHVNSRHGCDSFRAAHIGPGHKTDLCCN